MADIRQFFTKIQGRTDYKQEEGKIETRDNLTLDVEDGILVKTIDDRLKDAIAVKDTMDKINEANEKFYLGEQIDESKLFNHQAKIVDNRIYLAIDTIVPILATKKREPVVMPAQNTDESREASQLAQDFLSWKWDEQKMHLKMADIARFMQMYRYCALKYRFVPGVYNDFMVEVKRPECLVIDNKADEKDIEFIGEYLKDTAQGIIDRFFTKDDKVDKKKKDKFLSAIGINDKQLGTKVQYLEFWTNEFVVWKMKDIILDKAKNPNWLEGKKFNHFPTPQKPYVLFNWNNLRKGVYGDTTALEQAKPIQININKRKRQISDSADQANGTWVFNTKYISGKEVSKFEGAPNQHILYNGDAPIREMVDRIMPKDIGQQAFVDLQDDQSEIDNIFGTHSTTRGERTGQKTATESNLLKQSDYGRLDLMSQYLDTKAEEIYNAFVQMSLVYYDKMKTLKVLGPDNSQRYIDFSRDNLEEGLEIIVKSEPLLAKAEEMQKYLSLYQSGAVDPLTMYERFNLPNPKELTRRMIFYKTDPRMYIATFAIDENTEGMEDDPINTAKRDIQLLEKGEPAPPSPEINRDHIKEHEKAVKSEKFKRLKPNIQQNTIEHIRAEIEIMRGQMAQVQEQPQSTQQPMQPPTQITQ